MGPFYLVTYQPTGYKPTYLIVDGRSLALVRNDKRPEIPLRFVKVGNAMNAIDRMNDRAGRERESSMLDTGILADGMDSP